MKWYFKWSLILALGLAHTIFRDAGIDAPVTGAIWDMRKTLFSVSTVLAMWAGMAVFFKSAP